MPAAYIYTCIHLANLGVAMPLYAMFSIIPYMSIGPGVSSDFLYNGWPGSKLMVASRVLVGTVNVLKYPLIALPLRDVVLEQLFPPGGRRRASSMLRCWRREPRRPAASRGGCTFR
uniref:Uncharacterized protein n=1 Tax=Pyramimonas obovata TaxID=1411642 RepID=A0A7S0RF76_9CHLO|mmetsp:Transcript_32477/g.70955  ORF Transcript_32477/g.70955 Transcript_32477/m.70955 type:complete len:116 (+) Transcript_32477:239-586(+)